MTQTFISKSTVSINSPVSKVWQALTDPAMIKQYLFGTEAVSDWKAGSSITYKGVWEGKSYEDKGKVLEVIPEKLLVTSYWSSMTGDADIPENYKKVTYELESKGDQTVLTIQNDNNASQADSDHSAQNWNVVLDGLKKLLEK
jgi:uncharacterized protein YndB with AHSA1/START domain